MIWTPERDAFVASAQRGQFRAVAAQLGISVKSLCNRRQLLAKQGKWVARVWTPERDAELARRHQAGEDHQTKAQAMGLTYGQVRARCHLLKLTQRPKKSPTGLPEWVRYPDDPRSK